MQDEIDHLHAEVGSFEWIGILLYTKEKGNLTDPNGLVIRAHKMFPMDIGSPTHTKAKINKDDVLELYDVIPDIFDLKQGLIHTHHNMTTFFSGEDWEELEDNSPNHNYYLSLIVNFKGPYAAKIAILADMDIVYNFTDCEDIPVKSESCHKVLLHFDLNIYREKEDVSEAFTSKIKALREANKPAVTIVPAKVEEIPTKNIVQSSYKSSKQSDTITQFQVNEVALMWLNAAKSLLATDVTIKVWSVVEGVRWVSSHYNDKLSGDSYSTFRALMQELLVTVSEDFKPSIISKRVSSLFREAYLTKVSSTICRVLANIADEHSVHVYNMKKDNKKEDKPRELDWASITEENEKDYEWDQESMVWRLM